MHAYMCTDADFQVPRCNKKWAVTGMVSRWVDEARAREDRRDRWFEQELKKENTTRDQEEQREQAARARAETRCMLAAEQE